MTLAKFVVLLAFLLPLAGWTLHLGRGLWLARQLAPYGAEFQYRHGDIVSITFGRDSHSFGDPQVALLTSFGELQTLDLDGTAVTDAGLEVVDRLPQLDRLTVRVDQIATERERRLRTTAKHLIIEKILIIDGRRVLHEYAQ